MAENVSFICIFHLMYILSWQKWTIFTDAKSRGGGGGLFNWLALYVVAAQLGFFSRILDIVQSIFFLKFGLLQGVLFEKKCCNIGYTVLALLYILLNDALKVTYY